MTQQASPQELLSPGLEDMSSGRCKDVAGTARAGVRGGEGRERLTKKAKESALDERSPSFK